MTTTLHITQRVRCPAQVAYAFASDPANLPSWAAGLGGAFRFVDGRWRRATPAGDVVLEFVAPNDLGVLDHTVVLPDGTSVLNPMRVLPDGDDACELVFTLRRQRSMTDEDFDRDAAAVAHDLLTLQQVLESGRQRPASSSASGPDVTVRESGPGRRAAGDPRPE